MTTPEATPRQAQAAIDTRFVPVMGLAQRAPFVTFAILGITIGISLIEMATRAGVGREVLLRFNEQVMGPQIYALLAQAGYASDPLLMFGALIEPLIYTGQYWRLLTPIFLHPYWWLLFVNMYAVYNVGRPVELYFGHWRFLALYVMGAVGGNVLSLLVTDQAMSGSGTAIGALLAGFMVFVFRNKEFFGSRYQSALQRILITLGINIVIWLMPGMAVWPIVGGMMVGIAFAWTVTPLYKLMVAVKTDSEGQVVEQFAFFENQNTAAKGLLTGALISVVLFIVLIIAQFTVR